MAYFRGDHYIFDDGDYFHIWVYGRYEGWHKTGWADGSSDPACNAGVQVPVDIMDRFVLMRVAEMLVDKFAVATLDAMSEQLSRPGNSGEVQLKGNLELLKAAFADLERKCVPYRSEDFEADV